MKIGDKVRICENLHCGGNYKIAITASMTKLAGKVFTIKDLFLIEHTSIICYSLNGEAYGYYWTSDMFDYDYGAVTEETMENKYDAEELSTLYEL